jgi:hypothetical protein
MNQALFWAGGIIVAGAFIWAFAKMAQATGEARALREQAQKDLENARNAGVEVARHTDTPDSVDRLQSGKF